MDWRTQIRAPSARRAPATTMSIEELAQHAAPMYEAARADGCHS